MIPKRGEWIMKRRQEYCPRCGKRLTTKAMVGGTWVCFTCATDEDIITMVTGEYTDVTAPR